MTLRERVTKQSDYKSHLFRAMTPKDGEQTFCFYDFLLGDTPNLPQTDPIWNYEVTAEEVAEKV